jgi:ribosomal protein S18 acetylase RimI-like enzyme
MDQHRLESCRWSSALNLRGEKILLNEFQKHQVRDAKSADIETIVAFNRSMARETEDKDLALEVLRSGVRTVIENPTLGRYFVACHGDTVVGQLMITTEWSDWRNGQIWWIQSVYVLPDYRRRSVFRSLYRHVEQVARETAGVVGLRLYVEHNNIVAQRVYESLGMQNAGYLVFETMWSR